MALKKPAPAFEDATAPAAPTTVADAPAPAADQAKAAAQATTAIAQASASSKAMTVGGSYTNVFEPLRDALPNIEFGTLPRLVGSNGQIQAKIGGKKEILGTKIGLSLVSFSEEFVVTPGDDSEEATTHVKYSANGVTIDGTGEKVADYLETLRTSFGYEKAAVKRYVQLVGILTSAEKDSPLVTDMVQVSLAPVSAKGFDGYMIQRSVKIARGLVPADTAAELEISTDVRTKGKNDFTALVVAAAQ